MNHFRKVSDRLRSRFVNGFNFRRPMRGHEGPGSWAGLQPLEGRLMMSANPVITEFMALNQHSIADENGDRSDWVELQNKGDAPIDLGGYYLTNDSGDLDKWQLPSPTILNPGQFLIVFASGKDRAVSGNELHANFTLDHLGGDLALVQPNGSTIQSEFADYPALSTDQSFGTVRAQADTVFTASPASIKAFVPANNSLASTWTGGNEPFADGSWISGTDSIGFEVTPTPTTFTVIHSRSTTAIGTLAQADALFAGQNVQQTSTTTAATINYFDAAGGGGQGNFVSDLQFPLGGGDNFAIKATATFFVDPSQAGLWTFGINSDDGSRLRVDGANVILDDTQHGTQNIFGVVNLTAGTHTLELTFFELGGGAAVELFAAPGSLNSFTSAFKLVNAPGPGSLKLGGLDQITGTDIQAQMHTVNSTAYMRVPFIITDPADVTNLVLDVLHDDAFVAYLNGVQIGANNFTGATAFNAVADEAGPIRNSRIDLGTMLNLLQPGTNILALQGINASAADGDFYLAPTLSGRIFTTEIAKAFNVATPGAANGVLTPVISEFMASNNGGLLDEDGEASDWFELHNPGDIDINLAGWTATDDPLDPAKWVFPSTILKAGQYMVVFASNKDRDVPGSELHTNFRLNAAAEYMGLYRPGGVVAWEYSPGGTIYPQQFQNVSYGLAGVATVPTEVPERPMGLVAYYDFNQGSGTTLTDVTGHGFNGTLTNMEGADWVAGAPGLGTALDFDGVNEFVNTSALASQLNIDGNHARTISLWARSEAFTSGGIFQLGSNAAANEHYAFRVGTTNGLFTLDVANSVNNYSGFLTASLNVWRHIVLTYDPTLTTNQAKIYIDGVVRTQKTITGELNTTDNGAFQIGKWFGTISGITQDRFFNGQLDDLAIWDIAIPATSITSLFNKTVTPLTAPIPLNRALGVTGDGFNVTQVNASASFPGVVTGEIGGNAGSGINPLADADLLLSLPANDPGVSGRVSFTYDTINFYDTTGGGGHGNFLSEEPFPFDSLLVDENHFALKATATLVVPPGAQGWFILGFNGDEGGRLRVDGNDVVVDNTLHTPMNKTGFVNLTAGNHTLEFVFFERTGGASVELMYASSRDGVAQDNTFELLTVVPDQQTPPAQPTIYDSARVYFPTPTPGAANNAGVEFFVGDTTFSVEHGFFTTAFPLTILNDTPGVQIFYTTNGATPTNVPSGTNILYTGPINIATTTTIRARAFLAGADPSAVATSTYLRLADIKTQSPTGQVPGAGWQSGTVNGQVIDYGMDPDIVNNPTWSSQLDAALTQIPSISIVTDLGNLFDPATGIYNHAGNEGRAWERPISLELIDPNGNEDGFYSGAGLRIRGGFSRSGDNPKHAFRLFFRDEYGAGKLEYPLFGDEGVDEFDGFDLRTSQNYSWAFQNDSRNTLIRDVFSRDLQRDLGQPYTRSSYYHLYINGQYWGLYQSQERSEASYAESYFGGDKDEYDVVKAEAGPYVVVATDGNLDAWNALFALSLTTPITDATYNQMLGLNPDGSRNPAYAVQLDVDNLIDYMFAIYYGGNLDAPISNFLGNNSVNNWFGIRRRTGDEGWRFFAHDSEHTLLDVNQDRTGPWPAGGTIAQFNPQWLHQQLMSNPTYAIHWADRVNEEFTGDGELTPAKNAARHAAREAQINLAIIAESARWGDAKNATPYTKNHWQATIDSIHTNFFPQRTNIVINQFRNKGWYPSINAPIFSQNGGAIPDGFELGISLPGSPINIDTVIVSGTPGLTNARWFVPTDNSLGNTWTARTFVDGAWAIGPTGIGYETGTGYESLIGTSVQAQMFNLQPSVYFRVPFNITDPGDIQNLTLRMKYDDGYIAYLNGVEVARRNMTGTGYTAVATLHDDAAAVIFEDVNISAFLNQLVPGTNVLAIQGGNAGIASSDAIWVPELVSRTTVFSEQAGQIYYTLDGSDPRGSNGNPGPGAISYNATAVVINDEAAMNYIIPTGAPGETGWQNPGYVPTGWSSGTNGLGYDTGAGETLQGFTVKVVDLSAGNFTDVGMATNILNGTAVGGTTVNLTTTRTQAYVNHGDAGNISNPVDLPIFGTPDREQYAVRATANITIPVGTWSIAVGSDDGFRLTIPGVTFTTRVNAENLNIPASPANELAYSAPRGHAQTIGVFTVSGSPLVTTLQMDFYEAGGGDSVEMTIASGTVTAFSTASFQVLQNDTLGWQVSTSGISTSFNPFISTNVQAQMLNISSSAYVRYPFTVSNVDDISKITLGVKYDDGMAIYLNGTQVALRNAPGVLTHTSTSLATQDDSQAIVTEFIDLSAFVNLLTEGSDNVLAIQLLNRASSNPDALLKVNMDVVYSGVPFEITQSGPVKSRAFANGQWSPLTQAFFLLGEATLAVSEINYNPHAPTPDEINAGFTDANSFEFIEIVNIGLEPVSMGGVRFNFGIDFDFTGSLVELLLPGEHVVVVKNLAAFEMRYGTGHNVAGTYEGSLDNNGEGLTLIDAIGQVLVDFGYSDSGAWPGRADGNGSSLELINPLALPAPGAARTAYLNDGNNWRSSSEYLGSPGVAGVGPIVDVIINEILAHTDLPQTDTIELYNTTADPIDVSGWWISDSNGKYAKYQIPNGTIIAGNSYMLFDEGDFNPTPLTPGPDDFAFSAAHGDQAYLYRGAIGNPVPTTYADDVSFGATFNGETYGRVPNGDPDGDFFPNLTQTLGSANTGPKFGPVVISEIMYNHPSSNNDLEFVELYNSSSSPADLTGFRLGDAIQYDFPNGTMIGARSALVVLRFDPLLALNAAKKAAFEAAYGVTIDSRFIGGYDGNLSDGGEDLELQTSDTPPANEPLFTPHPLVDEADYDDDAPWNTTADGGGNSLHRFGSKSFGNLAASWLAYAPTPGVARGDTTLNNVITAADIDALFANYGPANNNPRYDLDGDGDTDFADAAVLVQSILCTYFGDVDLNRSVSIGDLTVLAENFGNPGGWAQGDFNGDGQVSIGDLTLLAENFGQTAALTADGLTAEGDGDAPAGLQALGSSDSAGSSASQDWSHIDSALDDHKKKKDGQLPIVDILAEI